MTSIAPMGTPVSGLRPPAWPMPLAALHALPSLVVTPVMPLPAHRAPVFGPNTGMIPLPDIACAVAVMATPLPVIDGTALPFGSAAGRGQAPTVDASRWRAGRIGVILGGAALVVTAIALLTTIVLRAPSAEPTASSAPAAEITPP
jgi:hypothetical protein